VKKAREGRKAPAFSGSIAMTRAGSAAGGAMVDTRTELVQCAPKLHVACRAATTSATETKVIAKSAQETVTELQAKVNVLESKQIEAQSQQLALEQLYQDLFKTS
jgi:hypothetical protein